MSWMDSESPLWTAHSHAIDAVDAITPEEFDEDLSDAEKAATLPLRGLGTMLSQASKPHADDIVPAIDTAIIEIKAMKNPTERVQKGLECLLESRKAFVAETRDPDKWGTDDAEAVEKGENPEEDASARGGEEEESAETESKEGEEAGAQG